MGRGGSMSAAGDRPPRFQRRIASAADRAEALDLLPPWLDLPVEIARALPDIWAAIDSAPIAQEAMLDLAQAPGQQMQAWGVTLGLRLGSVAEFALETAPAPGLSRRIYEALYRGTLTPMSDREIGLANARGELVLLNLQFSMRRSDLDEAYVHGVLNMANDTFRSAHAGFHLRAMYFEGGVLDAPYVTSAGFLPRPYAQHSVIAALPLQRQPMLYGLTREQAHGSLPGTSVRAIFDHHAPRFGLSASQRRLLLHALFDEPDAVLAERLGISPHGLKKLWRGIYERISDVAPDFFGDLVGDEDGKRGPEKRRQVLAYVRQRPEELRPWTS